MNLFLNDSKIGSKDRYEEKSIVNVFTDDDGNSTLHVAAMSKSASAPKELRLILSKRPDLLEQRNKVGRTPLHVAIVGEFTLNKFCYLVLII